MLQSIRFDLFLFLFCSFFFVAVSMRVMDHLVPPTLTRSSEVVHVLTSCMVEMILVGSYDSFPFTRPCGWSSLAILQLMLGKQMSETTSRARLDRKFL
jgi:hypothetical protein